MPSGGKDFVQIGIFSVEENAADTAARMRRDGLVPVVRESSASGKRYWRVLVGPASSEADRTAILKKVKALGFSDAYLVTG
jgi:cell division protein FtsN